MNLRWKKNPRPTGLAGVCSGPQGSTLRIDGTTRVATVYSLGGRRTAWYWVAGWKHPNIPPKNTCNEPLATEADAKDAAMAYVRKHLECNP